MNSRQSRRNRPIFNLSQTVSQNRRKGKLFGAIIRWPNNFSRTCRHDQSTRLDTSKIWPLNREKSSKNLSYERLRAQKYHVQACAPFAVAGCYKVVLWTEKALSVFTSQVLLYDGASLLSVFTSQILGHSSRHLALSRNYSKSRAHLVGASRSLFRKPSTHIGRSPPPPRSPAHK